MHHMTKSMWTPARQTFHSKSMGINMGLYPLRRYNSLHSSGKAFYLMLEHCCGDLLPISHKSISGVGHWCWAIRPGSQSAFQFIPKVINVVEIRAMCKPIMFFHTDLEKNPFLYGPHWRWTGAFSCWNRKGPSPNCCLKLEAHNRLECHCMLSC